MSPKPGQSTRGSREFNVRRKKNYRAGGGRLRTSTALTVSEQQLSISSSEEGREAVKAVCNEADEQQPGSGAILKELWELEREAFLKINEGMVSQCCINTRS